MARPRFAPNLQLEQDGLVLRPWQRTDQAALSALVHASKAELSARLDWCHAGYAEADAAAWITFSEQVWDAGSEFPFAVLDSTGLLLGSMGLNQINHAHRSANLGYWMGTPHCGRGVATRAARILCAHAFQTLALNRIEVVTLLDNFASQRVAEKLGARFECNARNRLVAQGLPRPARVYGLIPEDLANGLLGGSESGHAGRSNPP
ncbi:N-acetyltransferase [Ahniella affigens]|uniref:N-acetyltransferase n=1 Tax=Ahniella affigens TaxID=2021234 RepID=A0A2P1PMP7_9GAMM|nr:GNAT family protein [Ahniella affigens]AVP96112.1 N-acetyltransferase [Ahniella affigens]